MFSGRTNWPHRQNRLSELLERRMRSGRTVVDLTLSNPTACGLPAPDILSSLADPSVLRYQPDPRGLPSAREAVAAYYRSKNLRVDPEDLFLTSGTSEAYGHLLTLLCDPGDEILIPRPSYPLLEFLAQTTGVTLAPYDLFYDHGWQIGAITVTARTKAIIILNPHAPTGLFLSGEAYRNFAAPGLPLVVDEVFIDYGFEGAHPFQTAGREGGPLTFTLNGLSKLAALPQLKLGWIVVGGAGKAEAASRLETLCDTFLSVNTPAQVALPHLLGEGARTREAIRRRILANYRSAREVLQGSACTLLEAQGGWYGILRVPRTKTDEEWAIALLQERGISLSPGYFFDFEEEGYLVVSLLPEEGPFRRALEHVRDYVASPEEGATPALR